MEIRDRVEIPMNSRADEIPTLNGSAIGRIGKRRNDAKIGHDSILLEFTKKLSLYISASRIVRKNARSLMPRLKTSSPIFLPQVRCLPVVV